ncbi:two-component system response regulator [Agaribacter flavus]|uniref:EAL domain-containing protein n=1 Tax=Agaribacter flavus TaxID=1902781 RepID=A0ABV7FQE7_9ALTE
MQNLLIVDDEKHILAALKRTFANQPYTLFTAASANEALDVLSSNAIQVMITDFKMPEKNGAELIKSALLAYPEIVPIMLSGQADYEQMVQLMSACHVLKFIKKPWIKDDLLACVRQAFYQHQKNSHSSWQHRLNKQSTCKALHEFDCATLQLLKSKHDIVMCLLNLNNATDICEALGQNTCEHIQNILLTSAHRCLPSNTISYWHSPSTAILCFSKYEQSTFVNLLDTVRQQILKNTEQQVPLMKLDLRIAYQTVNKCFSNIEFLFEELKQNLKTLDAINHTIAVNDEVSEKNSRERIIRTSMENELSNGQFSLAIQPKVDLKSNQMRSGEILLRWEHSDLGYLSPEEFIGLAEAHGQITKLGNWVMERSISLTKMMTQAASTLQSISVNVSSRQLHDEHFISNLSNTFEQYDIDPQKIELELTETCIAENIDHVIPMLKRLKSLGVSLSMDDFGSGSTAYNYLVDLPIDTLKLDKCFSDNLSHSQKKQTLVRKLIEICHDLGINVVAEGVEDRETLALYRAFNCDTVQGYVFSPAIAPAAFKDLLVTQPFR